jgi:hypothetical protein
LKRGNSMISPKKTSKKKKGLKGKSKMEIKFSMDDKKIWKIKSQSHYYDYESNNLMIGDIIWLVNLEDRASLRGHSGIRSEVLENADAWVINQASYGSVLSDQSKRSVFFQATNVNKNLSSLAEANGLWIAEHR